MKKNYFAPQTKITTIVSESLMQAVSSTQAAVDAEAFGRGNNSDWDED